MTFVLAQILLHNPPLIFLLQHGLLLILGWALLKNYPLGVADKVINLKCFIQ